MYQQEIDRISAEYNRINGTNFKTNLCTFYFIMFFGFNWTVAVNTTHFDIYFLNRKNKIKDDFSSIYVCSPIYLYTGTCFVEEMDERITLKWLAKN